MQIVPEIFHRLSNTLSHRLERRKMNGRLNVGKLVKHFGELLHIGAVSLHKINSPAQNLLNPIQHLGTGI